MRPPQKNRTFSRSVRTAQRCAATASKARQNSLGASITLMKGTIFYGRRTTNGTLSPFATATARSGSINNPHDACLHASTSPLSPCAPYPTSAFQDAKLTLMKQQTLRLLCPLVKVPIAGRAKVHAPLLAYTRLPVPQWPCSKSRNL